MTTSTIVYFGSLADSKKGLQRTLVAFFVLWAIMFFLYKSKAQNTSIVKLAIASFAIALVLVSALGVQLPKSLKEAALYGALVGFVVSVSIASTTSVLFDTNLQFALTTVAGMTALCSILASLNYKYFSKIKI